MHFLLLPLILLSIPALLLAYREFVREKRNSEIEKTLPDVLLSISSLPHTVSFSEVLSKATSLNKPASILFNNCQALILRGAPVEIAISKSFSRYTPLVEKTGALLYSLHRNGNSLLPIFKELSIELTLHREAREAVKADASVQKYSLLISCAFLVPFIIALIYSVSQGASAIFALSPVLSPNLIALCINIYLVAFSFLAAKFLAKQFSSHFSTFFSITCPLSLLVFNFSSLLIAQ